MIGLGITSISALDNYETYLVDWTGLPNILESVEFQTTSEYDALNRVIQITLPENVNNERKNITMTYNRAGGLNKVQYDGAEYVENIVYNAKGQRLLIAFGNNLMTRYIYDSLTFRLLRQRSEKYVKSQIGNTITYEPQSGSNKQDDGFNLDLVGNILKILHRVTDCGINGSVLGSDALNRSFEYDPLYRVISGNGRESDTQHENDFLYMDAPAAGNPNANNVRAYTQMFTYDRLGNVQQVKHLGVNGFTRNFSYNSGYNTLQKIETATAALIEDYTYDTCGNQITAGTTRNYVWNGGNQLITYYNKAGSADPTIFAQYDYSGMNRVSKLVRTGSSLSPVYERTIYIDGIFEYCILENGTTYEKNVVHIMDDSSNIASIRVGDSFPDDISDDITYNLEDQIGSSVIRLDINGTIIDKEEYYPFGDSALRTFTKKRYRYVGKEKDLESGLYYYGARYYAAWTCRFISVDPLAADYPFYTPYNYAGNKPINKIDIDGMQEEGVETAPTNNENSTEYESIHITNEQREKLNLPETAAIGKAHRGTNGQYYAYNGERWINTIPETRQVLNKLIYVNGYLGFGSPNGGADYWNLSFDYGAQTFFGGNFEQSFYTNINHDGASTSAERQVAGYTYARNHYNEITKGLSKSYDQLYFVSHSMGGAFAFGMEVYFLERGWTVKASVFLNVFQASNLLIEHSQVDNIMHVEYRTTNDPVIDNDVNISGQIDLRITHKSDQKINFRHREPIDKGEQFWIDIAKGKNGNYKYFESVKRIGN